MAILRAVFPSDAPSYQVVNVCVMALRVCNSRTRRHKNAVQGRLAPT